MTKTQAEVVLHKKRFGQFFSGMKVADRLVSLLPKGYDWKTVVDPMAGVGDMLISVARHTSNTPIMLGVEIDAAVAEICRDQIPEAKILTGDAFKCPELITTDGWELVITNPPYVRYQLQSKSSDIMPSSKEIRKNLINQINQLPYLQTADRELFLRLAKNYSGLADMAVPAWILCAALVKKGGYLAVVVPETWLNRDYAGPIQYLLRKCFHIKVIVRNTNANWFTDAQVKTCLVVAKREETSKLSDTAKHITRIAESDYEYDQQTSTLFPQLKRAKAIPKWALSEDANHFSEIKLELQYELNDIIGKENEVEYVTLAEMGVECGQGLRTGANEFFYTSIEKDEGETLIVHSKSWNQGGKKYCFDKKDVVLALQNLREINGLVVTPAELKSCVIYPQGDVRGDLKKYIAEAEKYRDDKERCFKDFSAVRTNEKIVEGRVVREWFRLPPMARRHLPNLCITRVSARVPECLYIMQSSDEPIAVDANMVTLWSREEINTRIVLAMLNSAWSKLSLELICTVMGGGALKIEASHLKKLLLPKLSTIQLDALEKAGEMLIKTGYMSDEIQDRIDNIVLSRFEDDALLRRMRNLIKRKYNERSNR